MCAQKLGYTLHDSPELVFCDQCIFIVQRYFRSGEAPLDNPFLRIFTTGRHGVEEDETIWLSRTYNANAWTRVNINDKDLDKTIHLPGRNDYV